MPAAAAGTEAEPASAPGRRGSRLVVAAGAAATIIVAGLLLLRIPAEPGFPPISPIVGGAIIFDRDKVALSQSAGASLKQQADFLLANPGVKVTVRAYCSDDEGAHEGPQVLARLRAIQIRDALEAHGISGDRIKIENACRPGSSRPSGAAEATQAENRRAVLIRN